jgi:hypothetical protein
MKLINIGDKIYKISNSEFNIISKLTDHALQYEVSRDISNVEYNNVCNLLTNYIESNLHKYKCLGHIDFTFIF